MQIIIDYIKQALVSGESLDEYLNKNTKYTWEKDFPVAIVHEKTRVTDPEILQKMQAVYFFDKDGFSQDKYTPKMIEFLRLNAPSQMKLTSMLCHDGAIEHAYTYKEKFTHDRWKKVINDNNFRAAIEISTFNDKTSIQEIETEIRNIMRSKKEVPSLRNIAFIWIATLPNTIDISSILKHYFYVQHDAVLLQNKTTYIAWDSELQNINLRHFVISPS